MSQHDRPVDPLIARRDASVLDLTPPGTTPSPFDRADLDERAERAQRAERDRVDEPFDSTDGFDLFDEGPEPVAAWDRSPEAPRPVPPQLKVIAAIVATVAVIWAIVALRGPADDGSQSPTGTTVISATLALGTVQQNAGTTTVEATLSSAGGIDEVLSNHVWLVRDGADFPEAIAFIGCLAVDDVLAKPFSGTYEITTPVVDAANCGVGGFALAPGGTATVRVTALGLAPGAYRVLLAAWTSEPFTVA